MHLSSSTGDSMASTPWRRFYGGGQVTQVARYHIREFGRTFFFFLYAGASRRYRAIYETLIVWQSWGRKKWGQKGARGFSRSHTERPCIIVRASSPPSDAQESYLRTGVHARVHVYVRTNVLAHKSNFCISVVDITVPDPLPAPSLAGVACYEQETFGGLP